jgi:DNA-directed RNA polymerase delta subunit
MLADGNVDPDTNTWCGHGLPCEMYPEFAKIAEEEGNKEAMVLFKTILKVEAEHKTPAVLILAAGLGSRLGNLTKNINKAMLPINNKAIISHIIDKFPKDYEFVITLGYKGEELKQYCEKLKNGVLKGKQFPFNYYAAWKRNSNESVKKALELINKAEGGVTNTQIIKAIKNPDLNDLKEGKRLEAVIYNDLMTDGRFLQVGKRWDLKEKYTMKEILREQYRSLSETDLKKIVEEVENEEEFDEEIEMAVSIDDNEFDDAIALNDVQEFDDLESDR